MGGDYKVNPESPYRKGCKSQVAEVEVQAATSVSRVGEAGAFGFGIWGLGFRGLGLRA